MSSQTLVFNANIRCSIFIFDTYPGRKARKTVAVFTVWKRKMYRSKFTVVTTKYNLTERQEKLAGNIVQTK